MAERAARGAATPTRSTRERSREREEPSPAAQVRPTGPQCALTPAQLKSKIELGEPKKAAPRLQTMKAGESPRSDHQNKDGSKSNVSKTSGGAKKSCTTALALVLVLGNAIPGETHDGRTAQAEGTRAESARAWGTHTAVLRENGQTYQLQNRRSSHEHGKSMARNNRRAFGESHPPTVPNGSPVRNANEPTPDRAEGTEGSGESTDRGQNKRDDQIQAAHDENANSSQRAQSHSYCSLLAARCSMLDDGYFQPRPRLLHRGFEPAAPNQNTLNHTTRLRLQPLSGKEELMPLCILTKALLCAHASYPRQEFEATFGDTAPLAASGVEEQFEGEAAYGAAAMDASGVVSEGDGAKAADSVSDSNDLYHSKTGYILAYYPPSTKPEDRVMISEGALLGELNQLVIDLPENVKDGRDFPLFDGNLVAMDPPRRPPARVHGYDFDLAEAICKHNEFVSVPGITTGDGESRNAILAIRAKKADLSSIFSSSSAMGPTYNPVHLRLSHLKRLGGYIEVKLTDTQITMKINIQDVAKAIVGMGIKVYRKVWIQGKIQDDENPDNWLPLGENFPTSRMNFTIKPADCSMAEFDWSKYPTIPLTKSYIWNGEKREIQSELLYIVGGDELTELDDKGKTRSVICNLFDGSGCKRSVKVCKGSCKANLEAERARKRELAQIGAPSMKEAQKERKAAKREDYESRVRAGKAKMQREQGGATGPCKWVLLGRCEKGAKCKQDHSFAGNMSLTKCQLPKRQHGTCIAGAKCIYDCSLMPPPPPPGGSDECTRPIPQDPCPLE
jgi:hypothetical protein